MKKNIFFAAFAALALAFTACTDEPVIIDNCGTDPVVSTGIKSAEDLIGTNWEYTLTLDFEIDEDLLDCLDSADIAEMLTMTFGLSFDSAYAHLTFPEDMIGINVIEDDESYTFEEIEEMAYSYTYDPSTLSGTLTGGNLDDVVLPFTYDPANDIITVSMMVAYDDDDESATPFDLVFSRVI